MSGLTTAGRIASMWMDGRLVRPEAARLHALSLGLHNASCVFDGIRVYGGRPFALGAHVERFVRSASMLGMSLPLSSEELREAVGLVIEAGESPEAYVRPVAWRGEEVVGIDPTGSSVHVAVGVLRWPAPSERAPVRLALSRWARPGQNMMPVGAKASCIYAVGSLAHQEARAAGYDDALLTDQSGWIAEATGANIFTVRDGVVATPIADSFLDGITRGCVLELADAIGVSTTVTRLRVEDVEAADEVFLTGTACEIQPVASCRETELPRRRPVTELLRAAYMAQVRDNDTKGEACRTSASSAPA